MNEYLIQLLIKHEGLRLKPYRDTTGKFTIGVGRNLSDCGITEAEAMLLLENDIKRVIKQLQTIPTFLKLGETRQIALVAMTFNLGFNGILKFKRMWAELEKQDYNSAAQEMLRSKWAKQLPKRAAQLRHMIRENKPI